VSGIDDISNVTGKKNLMRRGNVGLGVRILLLFLTSVTESLDSIVVAVYKYFVPQADESGVEVEAGDTVVPITNLLHLNATPPSSPTRSQETNFDVPNETKASPETPIFKVNLVGRRTEESMLHKLVHFPFTSSYNRRKYNKTI
jgi:hypothetical protein